jgi:hypothetical protein
MNYTARLATLMTQILNVSNWESRKDLLRIFKNLRNLADKLSMESVECRRLRTTTATFLSLAAQFELQYSELEQWVTFALLL